MNYDPLLQRLHTYGRLKITQQRCTITGWRFQTAEKLREFDSQIDP